MAWWLSPSWVWAAGFGVQDVGLRAGEDHRRSQWMPYLSDRSARLTPHPREQLKTFQRLLPTFFLNPLPLFGRDCRIGAEFVRPHFP